MSSGLITRRLRERARRQRLQREVNSIPYWHHSIDLGDGVVTPGEKTPERHARELEMLHLPDLRGKSVIDIGCWDGFYAFAAEARGAARVVAVDSYIWAADFTLWAPPGERSRYPSPSPGRRGFELARKELGSSVEPVHAEVDELDPEQLGTFDVALFLGVLYHLRHPLQGLERVVALTEELLVVESHLNWYPGAEDRAICEFYETDELAGDPTNWWGPNARALLGLMRVAGCDRAELVGKLDGPDETGGAPQYYRGFAHGHR